MSCLARGGERRSLPEESNRQDIAQFSKRIYLLLLFFKLKMSGNNDLFWYEDIPMDATGIKTKRIYGQCTCTECPSHCRDGGCYCLCGVLDQSGQRCTLCYCFIAKHKCVVLAAYGGNLIQVHFNEGSNSRAESAGLDTCVVVPPEVTVKNPHSAGVSSASSNSRLFSTPTNPVGGHPATKNKLVVNTVDRETARVLSSNLTSKPQGSGRHSSQSAKRKWVSSPAPTVESKASESEELIEVNNRLFTVQVLECEEFANPSEKARTLRINAGLVGCDIAMPYDSGDVRNIQAIRQVISKIGSIPFKFVVPGNKNQIVAGSYGSSNPPGYQYLCGMYPLGKDVLIRLVSPLPSEVIDATGDDSSVSDDAADKIVGSTDEETTY